MMIEERVQRPFVRSRLVATHGISSGSVSARMLIESDLLLDVGAAASSTFSSAIMYCGSTGSISYRTGSTHVRAGHIWGYVEGCRLVCDR